MFRLQNNVPEVYVNKSRDFQLLCRLYDSCFGSVKFSIDSLSRSTSTKECDSSLLELLKTKLGLFTNIDLDDTELRYLLMAFPYMMRYKGSKRGIEYINTLYTKMYPTMTSASVEFGETTYEVDSESSDPITFKRRDSSVQFVFSEPPKNDKLLFELCKYLLPTGCTVSYIVASTEQVRNNIVITDSIEYETVKAENKVSFSTLGTVDSSVYDKKSDSINSENGALIGLSKISLPEKNL